MPRIAKGPRLYWRSESRKPDGSLRSKAGYFIRDGATFISTGCSLEARADAERQLADYIALKHAPQPAEDPLDTPVADVINTYLIDIAPKHARPQETAARLIHVLEHFGTMKVRDIKGETCRRFIEKRSTIAAARRELEDLRAALNHYYAEGHIPSVPKISLPEKSQPRFDFLTRSEAARLLWTFWRMSQKWKGDETARHTARHTARFMLVALYTGTRSAAVCGAAIRPTPGTGFVDLERGVFYRRAAGAKQTKKRQPPVRLPARLLAHMRRWERLGISRNFVVEWNGEPVLSVKKSFRTGRIKSGLRDTITPHILRHTAATWLMQSSIDVWQAAGYLGMTPETLQNTYGHHHPDFQYEAAEAFKSPRNPHRNSGNKQEHSTANVVQLIEKKRHAG